MAPTNGYVRDYNYSMHSFGEFQPSEQLTEVSFESNPEDSCEVSDTLEPDDAGPDDGEKGSDESLQG